MSGSGQRISMEIIATEDALRIGSIHSYDPHNKEGPPILLKRIGKEPQRPSKILLELIDFYRERGWITGENYSIFLKHILDIGLGEIFKDREHRRKVIMDIVTFGVDRGYWKWMDAVDEGVAYWMWKNQGEIEKRMEDWEKLKKSEAGNNAEIIRPL